MNNHPSQPLITTFDGTVAVYDLRIELNQARRHHVEVDVVEIRNDDSSPVPPLRQRFMHYQAHRAGVLLNRRVLDLGAEYLAQEIFNRMAQRDRLLYQEDRWRSGITNVVDAAWPGLVEPDDVLLALTYLARRCNDW